MANGKARFAGNRSARAKSSTIDKAKKARTNTAENTLTDVSERLGLPLSQVSYVAHALEEATEDRNKADQIVDEYRANPAALIQILLEIQKENHWLPRDLIISVCERLGVPLSKAYRIATFYKAFSLIPQGRHRISVCQGTACHVRGAPRLLDKVTTALDIEPGHTTSDMKFTLETVNCLGCCALGPVLVVDGEYHSNPSSKDIEDLVAACD